jgi:hypothetical protein
MKYILIEYISVNHNIKTLSKEIKFISEQVYYYIYKSNYIYNLYKSQYLAASDLPKCIGY